MARRTVKAWAMLRGTRLYDASVCRTRKDTRFFQSWLRSRPMASDERIIPVTVTYDDGKKKRRKK